MRGPATIVFACALLALQAACAADEEEGPVPGPALEYGSIEGAKEAVLLADERCDVLNGGDAWLLDSDKEPGGYRAAFVCL